MSKQLWAGGAFAMLRVRELVNRLKELPDQDVVVQIGEGTEPDVWLLVTGVVERRIGLSKHDPDCARPGPHVGYEVV